MITPAALDPHQVIMRIDAIIRELEALRQQVTMLTPATSETSGLTKELYGSLGHGSWEEYDLDLDWVRFSNDCASY